jgi:hypothetical protein
MVLPGSGAVAIGMVFATLTVSATSVTSGGLQHLTVFLVELALSSCYRARCHYQQMNALGRLQRAPSE